ncbi:thioredoxin family protein [Hymenobacter busanensis]|uniref:Thioredoxin family protein n=1 Tax=Hymenobacter busanensis TaxID=2607656 RepID=A0A7L4ZVP6_9BACT|nr:thioredoxin family protein [Hymenobacter busanensis]KAA9332372.1 thioredoxin family protein [Hymenobacter busanensis]QHJ07291.1 redoxin domain-containing protein [Hymenobacter busanensis]
MKKPLFLLTLLALVATLSSFLRPAEGGYQVGDKAADFKLKNVDGKLVSLADNKAAKGYIVVFTCNTCPYAQAYEDRIIALNKKYAAQGYPVVAINPNDPQIAPGDSYADMQKRARSKQYAFPYLLDESQDVARTYGATRTPHVYVLQRAGSEFKVAYIGAIDNNTEDANAATAKYVEQALTEIMAGKPATTSATKAVGCGIKWKKKA